MLPTGTSAWPHRVLNYFPSPVRREGVQSKTQNGPRTSRTVFRTCIWCSGMRNDSKHSIPPTKQGHMWTGQFYPTYSWILFFLPGGVHAYTGQTKSLACPRTAGILGASGLGSTMTRGHQGPAAQVIWWSSCAKWSLPTEDRWSPLYIANWWKVLPLLQGFTQSSGRGSMNST